MKKDVVSSYLEKLVQLAQNDLRSTLTQQGILESELRGHDYIKGELRGFILAGEILLSDVEESV